MSETGVSVSGRLAVVVEGEVRLKKKCSERSERQSSTHPGTLLAARSCEGDSIQELRCPALQTIAE